MREALRAAREDVGGSLIRDISTTPFEAIRAVERAMLG